VLLLFQSDTAVIQSVTFVGSIVLKINLLLFQCMKYELYGVCATSHSNTLL